MGGSIPTAIGGLTGLTTLSLQGDSLGGSIPQQIGQLTRLVNLLLDYNILSGPLAPFIAALTSLPSLSVLCIGPNRLSGTIPSSLGMLTSLTAICINGNALISGPVPTQLGLCSNLVVLTLDSNSLSGTLPSSLGGLTGLTTLWLHSNVLTGPVPASFCRLKSTVDLRVHSNPGLTCYPSCLVLNSNFFSNGGNALTACPTSTTITLTVTMTFSGLTQAIIASDSDTGSTINAAIVSAVETALGFVSSNPGTVSQPMWDFTLLAAAARAEETRSASSSWWTRRRRRRERRALSTAKASAQLSVTAAPTAFLGGYSAAQVSGTIAAAEGAMLAAVQNLGVVLAASANVALVGAAASHVAPTAAPVAAPSSPVSPLPSSASASSSSTLTAALASAAAVVFLLSPSLSLYYYYMYLPRKYRPSASAVAVMATSESGASGGLHASSPAVAVAIALDDGGGGGGGGGDGGGSQGSHSHSAASSAAPLMAPGGKAVWRFRAFLTHNWGTKQADGTFDVHERVLRIARALQAKGYAVWIDAERMTGAIVQQMCDGIDDSDVVVVFITQAYIDKVRGSNANDNCLLEFKYAMRRKSKAKMVAVVLEAGCRNANDWQGPVGMALGPDLYVDFCSDDGFDAKIDRLCEEVDNRS